MTDKFIYYLFMLLDTQGVAVNCLQHAAGSSPAATAGAGGCLMVLLFVRSAAVTA